MQLLEEAPMILRNICILTAEHRRLELGASHSDQSVNR